MKQKYHEFLYFIYTVGFDVLGGVFISLFASEREKENLVCFHFWEART